jgi:hypothetical protein
MGGPAGIEDLTYYYLKTQDKNGKALNNSFFTLFYNQSVEGGNVCVA